MAGLNCIPSNPNNGNEIDVKQQIQQLVNESVREGRSSFSFIVEDLYQSETVVEMINDGSLRHSEIFAMINKAKKITQNDLAPAVKKLVDEQSNFIMMEAEVLNDESGNDYDLMKRVIRRMISTGRLYTSQFKPNEIEQIVNTVQSMVSSRFEDFTESTFQDTLQQKKEKTKSIAEIFNTNEEELEDAMEESVAQSFDDKKFDGDTKQMHKLWSPVAKQMQVTPDYLLKMIGEYSRNVNSSGFKRVKDFYLDAANYNPKLQLWVDDIKNASNALLVSLNQYMKSMVQMPAFRIIETSYGNYQMVLSNAETNKFQIVSELNRLIQRSPLSDISDQRENWEDGKKTLITEFKNIISLRNLFISQLNKNAGFKSFANQFSNRSVDITVHGNPVNITYKQFFNTPQYVTANIKKAVEISNEFLNEISSDPRVWDIYQNGMALDNSEIGMASKLTGIPMDMLRLYNVADIKLKNGSGQATFSGFDNITQYYMMQQALAFTYKKMGGNIYWNIISKIDENSPVKSANTIRNGLTKSVQSITDKGTRTLSPQVDTIARVNLKPRPDQLSSSYQDVGKDLKTTGEYNSPISKMTNAISSPSIQTNERFEYVLANGTLLHNPYLTEGNPNGELLLLDGALMQEGAIKADGYNGEDIMINHLTLFFTTDFSKMFGENKTGQLIEVMSDKGKQIYVPVRKYGINESKQLLKQLQHSSSPEISEIAKSITEEHLNRDIKKYKELLQKIYKKIKLEERIKSQSFEELATEFAYSYAVNKALTDHYYYGKPYNYAKGYIDKVKREMRASGVNPDTNIDGGMGKKQKTLILPDFAIDMDLYKPFFESIGLNADEAELNDGITIIDLDQNARINKSYGSMFNFSGSIKAIYNHMDQETGEHTYIKTNTIVFDDDYANFVADLNAERGTPDFSIMNLLQIMRETGIQSVSFTSGAKRSKTGKANTKAISENNEFLSALKESDGWRKILPMLENNGNLITEDLYNESYFVQQDQRQPTSETEGKMPTQGLAYFLPLDSGPSIVGALNEIAKIETDRLREELDSEGSSPKDRVLKKEKPGEFNPILEKFKIPGYPWWNDQDCMKLIYTSIGADIKKKAIDTKVNKNILTEIPAFGIKLKTYGGMTQTAMTDIEGKKHWQFPEVLVPTEFANRYIAGKVFGSLAEAEEYRGTNRTNPIFEEMGGYRVEGDKIFIERIPTSALHSLSLVEIAGFVSPVMENMIVIDPGTQKMSGSDNDGDQRHTMGEYRSKDKLVTFTEENQKELDDLNRFLANTDDKTDTEIKDLKKRKRYLQDKKKKSLSNQIIALMKSEYETLIDGKPKNHEYITTPIDTQSDRTIALKAKKESESKLVPSPLSLVDGAAQFDANRNGKIGISIQANDNAAFTYILSQNIQYKRGIPTLSFKKGKVSSKKGNFMALDKTDGVISKKVNTVIFDLANKLNHATDNAKEQSMDLLGMMQDTITFGSILRMSGSANEDVIQYMQSDFFQDMLKKLNGRESMLRNEQWRDVIDGMTKYLPESIFGEKNIFNVTISDYDIDSEKTYDHAMALAHFAQLMNVANDIQFTLNPIIRMTKDFGFRPWDLVQVSHLKNKLMQRFDWPGFSTSPVLYRNETGYALMEENGLDTDIFFRLADWDKLPTLSPKIIESIYNTSYEVLAQSAFSDYNKQQVFKDAKAIYQKQNGILKEALVIDIGAENDTLSLSSEYKKQVGNVAYEESVRNAFSQLPREEKMILMANQILNNGTATSVQAKGYYAIIDNETQIAYGKRKDKIIEWYIQNKNTLSPYGSEVFWIGNLIRHNPRIVENVMKLPNDANAANYAAKSKENDLKIVKAIKADTEQLAPFIITGKRAYAVTGIPRFHRDFNFGSEADIQMLYALPYDETSAFVAETELSKQNDKRLVEIVAIKVKNSNATFANAGEYAEALKKEMEC